MNNLRKYREKAGLNQSQLAEKSGIQRPTLNRIENGNLPLTLKIAGKLAPILKCEPGELLGADNIRILVICQDKDHVPTFEEACQAFVRYYGKEFMKGVLGKKPSKVFAEKKEALVYEIMRDLPDMKEEALEEIMKLVLSHVKSRG